MPGEWETVSDWEPVLTVPVSPDIPFADPEETLRQQQAGAREAKQRQFQDWRLEQIRNQFSPMRAATSGAVAEVGQFGIGLIQKAGEALNLAGVPQGTPLGDIAGDMQALSDETERNLGLLREARPVATTAGQIAPYVAAGAPLQRGYLSAVQKAARKAPLAREFLMNPTMRGAIPGAVEGAVAGAVHPQLDPLQTTAFGAAGGALGGAVAGALSRQPKMLTPMENQIVNKADRWDMILLPGARSGISALKRKDYALSRLGEGPRKIIDQIDEHNQSILTDKVTDVMGLKAKDVTPEVLSNHLDTLGNQYQKLLKDVDVFSSPKLRANWARAIDEFREIEGSKSATLEKLRNVLPEEGNKIPAHVWHRINKRLNSAIRARSKTSVTEKGAQELESLRELSSMLRNAALDTTSYNQPIGRRLRELNTKYAATMFSIENRLIDPVTGHVNTTKLLNALQRPQNVRAFNTGSGPWRDMHDAARIGTYIQRSREPSLSGPYRASAALASRPARNMADFLLRNTARVPIVDQLAIGLYRQGFPHMTGLMNLPAGTPSAAGLMGAGAGITNQPE